MENLLSTRATLTVSELTARARNLLEFELSSVWVVGEIAAISMPVSGHWYFTIKDDNAQIRCAMFRQRNIGIKAPAQGDDILVCGKVSLYEARGEFQLIVSSLEHRGTGLLHQQFEQLKIKLQKEGLFDPALKRALPPYPSTIGILTSRTGAALHDMLSVLNKHRAPVQVLLYPCVVQGESASASLLSGLRLANRHGRADVLILGRGGGSYEDLHCFNDERLARAIRASQIPAISAVGHEVDFTIADFVSDYRAPTPTAAMEWAIRTYAELPIRLRSERRHLQQAIQQRFDSSTNRLLLLQKQLTSPARLLEQQNQHFDQLEVSLHRAMQFIVQAQTQRLSAIRLRLLQCSPKRQIQQLSREFFDQRKLLQRAAVQHLKSAGMELARLVGVLESTSPLATISRGYTILSDTQGKIVRSISQVKPDDKLSAKIKDGTISLVVKETLSAD